MTVTYRQPIVPHDRGLDVIATKRALQAMGHRDVNLSRYAGHAWEHAIRTVQHNQRLRVDGVYGRRTHSIISAHMDDRAVYLYRHARLRHRSDGYVNPFRAATIQVGRVDEGVDYHGRGPIHAWADFVVVGIGGSGWPDSHYLNFRVSNGRHAGRFYYLAEAISPVAGLYTGKHVKAGETIAYFRWDAAPGLYPGIEHGWGSPITNLTWAAVTHRTGPPPYSNTPPGQAFARLSHAIGCPAPPVPAGSEFV